MIDPLLGPHVGPRADTTGVLMLCTVGSLVWVGESEVRHPERGRAVRLTQQSSVARLRVCWSAINPHSADSGLGGAHICVISGNLTHSAHVFNSGLLEG